MPYNKSSWCSFKWSAKLRGQIPGYLSLTYEVNHSKIVPQTPNHEKRQLMIVTWQVFSNAAGRSNRTMSKGKPLNNDNCTLFFSSQNKADSVEWPVLYADWSG